MPHIVLAALLIAYPAIGSNFFLTQIGAYSLILGMIALSLMLLAGYGGMVSLAQISVAGIAGYAVAIFGAQQFRRARLRLAVLGGGAVRRR